jgi:hypothetical protein
MVDAFSAGERSTERVALDIKVINALGANHFDETLGGPLVATAAYREHAIARLDTGARCAARGIKYEPLVFTTQGGCEAHAEAVITQIANAVAKIEGRASALLKAEMLQTISMSIARSIAKAVLRRKKRRWTLLSSCAGRVAAEFATLQEPGEDE